MGRQLDISGQKFGMLTAVTKDIPDTNKRTRWLFQCECGNQKVLDAAHVRYGRIWQCGCKTKEIRAELARKVIAKPGLQWCKTHGMSKKPVYFVWKTMRQRCLNPKAKDYQHYGALGVTICERWAKFENFYVDMGDPPDGLTLERIDVFGNYTPENCKWATWSEQNLNKRKKKCP